MFTRKITVFRLFGFTVSVDLSWFFILILITWSLASAFFPVSFKGYSTIVYLLMGISGALGLFLSVTIHEFSHSLVARRYGLPIRGITLFIFGGVAEMEDEPPSPAAEFAMAIAGLLTSVFLGVLFTGIGILIRESFGSNPFFGVLKYLGYINWALSGFNIIPAFPLDGGRVLRSVIWKSRQNLKAATRISSRIGVAFAFLLIAIGLFSFLRGNFVSGMWWFLIGLFLNNASRSSYQQILTRQALEGEKVRRFMKADPVTVPAETTISELVENYIYHYHYKMFPVVRGMSLIGCITTKEIHGIPRTEWKSRKVAELATGCALGENTVTPGTDAIKVLSQMKKTGKSRLMVVENGKLLGIISLKDMLEFISLKVELEEEMRRP